MDEDNRAAYAFITVVFMAFFIVVGVMVNSNVKAVSKQCEDSYFVDMPFRQDIPLNTTDIKEAGWLAGSHRIYMSRVCQ